MARPIDGRDVQDMVRHWLSCPVNGYLGSSYGSDLPAHLQRPLSSDDADQLVHKMRSDIPIVGAQPQGIVNVYQTTRGHDQRHVLIEVAGQIINPAE